MLATCCMLLSCTQKGTATYGSTWVKKCLWSLTGNLTGDTCKIFVLNTIRLSMSLTRRASWLVVNLQKVIKRNKRNKSIVFFSITIVLFESCRYFLHCEVRWRNKLCVITTLLPGLVISRWHTTPCQVSTRSISRKLQIFTCPALVFLVIEWTRQVGRASVGRL